MPGKINCVTIRFIAAALALCWLAALCGCVPSSRTAPSQPSLTESTKTMTALFPHPGHFPKIASWLAKKDEITASQKPYGLVMTAWFTPEEAAQIKTQNPDAVLMAGLSFNWVWDNRDWMTFLQTVAGYGRAEPFAMTEEMYLHQPDGKRVAFGWASKEWGHEEIYAMDPGNSAWVEMITAFYKNVLDQPQHDGIIIDMVTEKSWCPETISDSKWVEKTLTLFNRIKEINFKNKPVFINAGRDISEVDAYSRYFDGYLMENFMGAQVNSTFEDGLKAGEGGFKVIYAVDTDDTGIKDMNKMRLGLVLSLLFDNAYFTYDFGPRDHGQAWWFSEYDVDLGNPLGGYYKKGDAYYRDFEKGIVAASPYSTTAISFNRNYTDATTGSKSTAFNIEKGDGRIYLMAE